jgi:hypothetical protein
MNLLDPYYLRARFSPTAVTSIPVISLYWYFIRPIVAVQLAEIPYLPMVGDVTLSATIVFLLIQVNRFLSKEIFQRWFFKDELEMPTTNYLLLKDVFFTPQSKRMIREKIHQTFGVELYDEDQEKANEVHARKQICLAVSQIRTFLKENEMLLRHNIEYGFFRNLLGGCVLSVISSLIGLSLSYSTRLQNGTFYYFLVLSIVYVVPILLSKIIVKRFGSYYAKVLYEQFLSTKPQA